MSITMKSADIQQRIASGHAKYVFTPKPVEKPAPPPPVVVPDTSIPDAVNKVAEALTTVQQESKATISRVESGLQNMAAMLSTMQDKEPMGPWKVTVTKRDPLGRILEVEFKPN